MPTREPACVIKDYTNEQHSREALILQEHARSCAAARFEMHMAKREAAAADAAVSAVAQVSLLCIMLAKLSHPKTPCPTILVVVPYPQCHLSSIKICNHQTQHMACVLCILCPPLFVPVAAGGITVISV